MNRRKDRLPIIIGHSTKTGIMVFPNRNFGGSRDMVIVGLNKEIPTGQQFEIEDIDWVKAVLHFSDVDALQTTVDILAKELERWRKERKKTMRKADFDRRICDVETGASNTETYREFLTNSIRHFYGDVPIPDYDSMTEEELNDWIDEMDMLWAK